MGNFFDSILVTLFLMGTSLLALYGLHLYVLDFLFWRKRPRHQAEQRTFVDRYIAQTPDDAWLGVTSQIPIYNEAEVATRVINAVAAMDYPQGKHHIQVLDDSTDETRLLIDRTVRRLREQGVDIEVVRRDNRQGFKAGALKIGLARSEHPLVAIFDADFVPPIDFLRRATPLLARDAGLACLQGRWAHLNGNESWMTRGQALGLDAHFSIEQGARAWNGLMMNFNGTAGVWRKEAIEDPAVGGWSADTLTEDLDLSYRAQLAGWRMDFCLDLACPAELPSTIAALKSQQRRWATGGTQTAVKLLPRIWRAPIGWGRKLEATIHLTHSFASIGIVLFCLLVRPMLVMMDSTPHFWSMFTGWTLMILSTFAPSFTYTFARRAIGGGFGGLRDVPTILVLGTGLAINNSLAVLKGLYTRGGEFVRTPKSGTTGNAPMTSRYKAQRQQTMWFFEMLLGACCLANWAICVMSGQWLLSVFLAVYAYGLLQMGWLSRPEAGVPRRWVLAEQVPDAEEIPTLQPAVNPLHAS